MCGLWSTVMRWRGARSVCALQNVGGGSLSKHSGSGIKMGRRRMEARRSGSCPVASCVVIGAEHRSSPVTVLNLVVLLPQCWPRRMRKISSGESPWRFTPSDPPDVLRCFHCLYRKCFDCMRPYDGHLMKYAETVTGPVHGPNAQGSILDGGFGRFIE